MDLRLHHCHVVAGVLRRWLNDLPEPLIPTDCKKNFYIAIQPTNDSQSGTFRT